MIYDIWEREDVVVYSSESGFPGNGEKESNGSGIEDANQMFSLIAPRVRTGDTGAG